MPQAGNDSQSFADTLQSHLVEWRPGVDGSRRRDWDHWADGIYPEYRGLAQAAVRDDEVRLHRYASHLRSSQVFAFNLFLPFREGNREHLSRRVDAAIGTELSIEDVRFEWVPPGHILGELHGERPVGNETATGVDIVLWGKLPGGARCAVLIEVKLSETDFTHCNGRTSPANRRRDICDSADLFFTDPSACYLTRPRHQRRDRRYWEIFAGAHGSVSEAFPGVDRTGTCPFAFGMQQPMRNLAVARGLEQDEGLGSPRRGSSCVPMTATRTSMGIGGNGGASFRTPPWPHRCQRPRLWPPARPRGSPDGPCGCATVTFFEGRRAPDLSLAEFQRKKLERDASLEAMPPQPKDFVFQRGAAGEQKGGLMFVKMLA